MARIPLDDGVDALRRRELELRLHQLPDAWGVLWLCLQRSSQCDTEPIYAGGAVPDTRQHQGILRVPVPAFAIRRDCDESIDRFADSPESLPHQHSRSWFRIRVLTA